MFLLTLYFHTHPLTLLLEILGGQIHGPSPTSNYGGTVPSSPPKYPALITVEDAFNTLHVKLIKTALNEATTVYSFKNY